MRPAWDPAAAAAALAALAAQPVTPLDKGFAGLPEAVPARELVGRRIDDPVFSTPLLVLRESALEHNVRTLADWTARQGALLAPHAKTTMSPELFTRQLAAGAWALTAASPLQAAVFAAHGARRALIANEVTDPAGIVALGRLLAAHPDLELLAYVDSADGVGPLRSLAGHERFAVLVELGIPGGRAGLRDVAGVLEVAGHARAAGLRIAGVSCFEGPLGDDRDAVRALFRAVRAAGLELAAAAAAAADADDVIVSAGGSHHFDLAAEELAGSGLAVVVRSGSSIVHDHGVYLHDSPAVHGADLAPFRPAIEVRARVLSRPEPGLALLDAGRRDVSFDAGMPTPLDRAAAAVTQLNDQHGFLRIDADDPLRVGDLVRLGISHPCTTLDKWRHTVIVDDDDRVTAIGHSFF